jgi:RNA polymerase sigma factor (sigma-70 family)
LSEIAHFRLRYKLPSQSESLLAEKIISKEQIQPLFDTATEDFRFVASVAAFGQLLRQSSHLNDFSFQNLRSIAKLATGSDAYGYRQEFLALIDVADSLNQINQRENELYSALQQLPNVQREAVLLRHIAGMSIAEIATVVETATETIKSRLRYAISKLRTMLEVLS